MFITTDLHSTQAHGQCSRIFLPGSSGLWVSVHISGRQSTNQTRDTFFIGREHCFCLLRMSVLPSSLASFLYERRQDEFLTLLFKLRQDHLI